MDRSFLRGLAALLLAVTMVGAAAAPALADPTPAVVNGTNAPPGQWPWITVLLHQDPSQPGAYYAFCDGALIAPQWVLTAAHCVTGDAPSLDALLTGRQTPSSSDGDPNQPTQVIVHPGWTSPEQDDIALIKLQHPSPFQPVPLIRHEQSALWAAGSVAEVIGFGDTSPNSPSAPSTLQQAQQTVLADDACAASYSSAPGAFVASSMVCTGAGTSEPCFGDSGGPLMAPDGSGWREFGVVSHGTDPCGQRPTVYSRLESQIDWIYATIDDPVQRLSGLDRVATSIAVSQASFPTSGSAGAAVLANFQSFADALPGTPLAAAKGAPLLLTPGDALDARVEQELARAVAPNSTVYVLGGSSVMSDAIETRLQQLGYTVVRYGGENRYATAVLIAEQGLGSPSTVIEATGLSFADALSGGAAAVAKSGAVLLTDGDTEAAETAAYITNHNPATRLALGGPAAAADPGATAIVGADRYATSAAVASQLFAQPTVVGLASGVSFPDALSGGAHISRLGGPVLLVPPTGLIPDATKAYLQQHAAAVSPAFVYGGLAAVSVDMAEDAAQAIT